MENSIQHEIYGTITYKEGNWSGKKTIWINGTELEKIDKKLYRYTNGSESFVAEVSGSALSGVVLNIKGEKIQVVAKPAWYVLAFSILIFAFVLFWGNNPALVQIFPIVGGALGGLVSALFAIANVTVAGRIQNVGLKILTGVLFFAATIVVCYILAVVLVLLIAA